MNLREMANEIEADIANGSHAALSESPFRKHLGASLLGRDCLRELVYTFRWAYKPELEPRIRRLLDRGEQEEKRVAHWLRLAGWNVNQVDPLTGEQYRVSFHEGHGGGGLDAIMTHQRYGAMCFLGEFKTHKDSSFNDVKSKRVKKSKFEHYVQMVIYMEYFGLSAAVYFAVNKDTDEIYVEIVNPDPETARKYVERAGLAIGATSLPPRISESPAFWKCKFCDFNPVCHAGEPLAKNCRSCRHSVPTHKKQWICRKFNEVIDEPLMKTGCDHWASFE